MLHKFSRSLAFLLPALMLALMLVACSNAASTSVSSVSTPTLVSPRPTPTTIALPSPTASLATAALHLQPDTVPVQTTTPIQPTSGTPVAPVATLIPAPTITKQIPTAGTAETEACSEPRLDESFQGQPSAATLKQLPHLNGILKLPVLNPVLCSPQPLPVIKADYGLNNAPRIGVQIGHYQIANLPDELASLRGQTGGGGGGTREVDFNQAIARRVAAILKAKGATVDILPATVPAGYTADAFVAIHADASLSSAPRGYKLARSRFSAIPQTDDALLQSVYSAYGNASGLPIDNNITRDMTGYYAFNARNRLFAVSKVTPSIIIEMGYLSNPADHAVLLNQSETLAEGIANGVWNFIETRPALDRREKPVTAMPAIEATLENTPVYASSKGGNLLAYVSNGQRFEYFEDNGTSYSVYVPVLRKRGYVLKADVTKMAVPR